MRQISCRLLSHMPGLIAVVFVLLISGSPMVTASDHFAPLAAGTTITVTTTSDELNTDGDCSLREAITAANTNTAVSGCAAGTGDDTITFAVGGAILLWETLPTISSNLTITGPGMNYLTIEARPVKSGKYKLIKVGTGKIFKISGLTLTGGVTYSGIGIENIGGTVTVDELTFYHQTNSNGGAIYNTGSLTVKNSIFYDNSATNGGAIFSSGTLNVINSMFVSNRAENGRGGALAVNSGTVRLINSTIYDNQSFIPPGGGGSALWVNGGTVYIQNTIIASSVGSSCLVTVGNINSLGRNIDNQTAGSCRFSTVKNDLPNGTNPLLDYLVRYTPGISFEFYRLPLRWGSPAIDAGDDAVCASVLVNSRDQRAEMRPLDGNLDSISVCDIGAYELRIDSIPTSEQDALAALYNAAGGPGWIGERATSWRTDPNPCSWHGVTCKDGHVSELNLALITLNGFIPPEIGDLTSLERLILSFNEVTGGIPPEIGSLTNLKYLALIGGLSGPLPEEIGSLTNLEYLNLSGSGTPDFPGNEVTGSIPDSFGNLTNLRYLNLSFNQLNGPIPDSFGNLVNLEQLRLNGNQLTGSLPSSIGALTHLAWLNLEGNLLSGAIPAEIGNLTGLEVLNLRSNQFSGAIPASIGSLNNLWSLNLQDNLLTGSIPPEIGNLTELRQLYLDRNLLTGSIPPEIGSLPKIEILSLTGSQLTGSIPPEIRNLTTLRQLALSNNQLSGAISPEVGNLTNLELLWLHNNQLTGYIPPEIGSLTNLTDLTLSNNQLIGEIPATIVNLTKLQSDLNRTDFSYNAFYATSPSVASFLNGKDANWAATQTIAPGNFHVNSTDANSVDLSWTPFLSPAYGWNVGYYEISYALSPAGPYRVAGITADKSTAVFSVTDLAPDTPYYFRVRTFTPAFGSQLNNIWSDYSAPVSATTGASVFCTGVSQIPFHECVALESLYYLTDGPHWTVLWMTNNTPCSWAGITCDNGHVTTIALTGSQLDGPLPSQLGSLTYLEQLLLGSNQLTGSIPASLAGLTALQNIDLRSNQLTGGVPAWLSSLTGIQYLQLGDNPLGGAIPPSLGVLTGLIDLYLGNSQLTGSIPDQLASLVHLENLGLNGNQLTGSIPAWLGNFSGLKQLGLENNRFTGGIPASLGNLALLERLGLHNNGLTGEIPVVITNLNALDPDYTDLGYNALYTTDPAVIAFLNVKDPDWAATQTVAPGNITASIVTDTSVTLSWIPIAYTGDGGYYEISYATSLTGPYMIHGFTADKTALTYLAGGLMANKPYYFRVRTFTPAHSSQQNALWSDYGYLPFPTLSLPNAAPPRNFYTALPLALAWNRVSWAAGYEIQVATTPAFTLPLNYTRIVDSETLAVTDVSLPDGTYYWRVRAKKTDGTWGAWSAADSFLVDVP